MAGVTELAPLVGVLTACAALGVPRASFYRRQHPVLGPRKRPSSPRALTPAERATVLGCLHEERFQDRAPAAVYATLLDEGLYHCSIVSVRPNPSLTSSGFLFPGEIGQLDSSRAGCGYRRLATELGVSQTKYRLERFQRARAAQAAGVRPASF